MPEKVAKYLFEHESELNHKLSGRAIVLFFDYDGTLTPIVKNPAAARLDPDMRRILRNLAEKYKVALVSGRDLQTLQAFVELDNVYYAGSHGFEIVGPGNLRKVNEEGEKCKHQLAQAEEELRPRLVSVAGCEIERKAFALAIHYRNVNPEEEDSVFKAVEEVADNYPKLRRGGGKKIIELQPDVEWDKGRAVLWLLDALGLDSEDAPALPLYIGDDLTDEDAFKALAGRGIGVYVGDRNQPTAAEYRLADVEDVRKFLGKLVAKNGG